MQNNRDELLNHLAASLKDAKADGGAILLVGAGISVSAGIPPAQKLMKIAIENFPDYFTEEQLRLAQEDLGQLQYNDIMTKLSPIHRKEIFNWHIQGHEKKKIPKAKLNFAHLAIAELLKQGYIKRILTTNFDPLLINACYMVGMYPLPSIYDLGSINQINPELFDDPCIIYLNGQHAGQVQRNTSSQLTQHQSILNKVVLSTGCKRPWIVAGYSGENDPLMVSLNELRPYNNWLYWLEYSDQVLQKESHQFLEQDEECKIVYGCDADETFMEVAEFLDCSLDFIEQPYTELELYTKEINFNTSKSKGHQLLSKVKNYISILKKDAVINKFKLAEIVTNYISNDEFHSYSDDPNYSKEKLISTCEELYPVLKDSLSGEFFYWWAGAYCPLNKEFDSRYIDEKISAYEMALTISQRGIKQDPQFGGNFHYCGIYQLELAKLIQNNTFKKNELLNHALQNFRSSDDYAEHVMYSLECYILLENFNQLIDYFNESLTLEIVKNHKTLIFQEEYIPALIQNDIFCNWYKSIFHIVPNKINMREIEVN